MKTAELKISVVKEIAELSDEQFMQVYDDLMRLLHASDNKPSFGSAKGLVTFMADDFDAPLNDFNDYMP
ncbi:type II toxin-antitoxin system prevent-host-death family antitoxin [Spirosoma fluviale]|uniref:DUF2281 domain-containing protein n=1 Tax=Spirosoma fluviale TaxID=1597977 RepID=A0A286GVJ5_9BACT|nr:type II toxin-antitoxin system prevent-host-death family antitoxin [Spirosoma fluviale]SOD99577.1 hypothetical protein SAMN06269250_0057 [Spirosoma fluviale]